MNTVVLSVSAYLIGSFPSAFILSRLFGRVDIRSAGSGNVGGMNTYRVAGLLPGILTVLLDLGKGIAVILLASTISGEPLAIFSAGFFAVLGHNFSIYLGLKGGKGLATTAGIFLILSPLSILYAIICALVLTYLLRDINTAFGGASILIPFIVGLQYGRADWIIFGCLIALVITLKHLPDFKAYKEGRRISGLRN